MTVGVQLSSEFFCDRLFDTMASNKTRVIFKENPLKYIWVKAGIPFWITFTIFIFSLLVILNVRLDDPPQSMFLLVCVRFFDIIGTIALFLAYLSVGISEQDYIR